MSYVRVEHFVPSRDRAVRRVRLRCGADSRRARSRTIARGMFLSSPSARDGTASLAFYVDYSFMRFSRFSTLSKASEGRAQGRYDARVCVLTVSLGTASRASPPRAGASPRRAGGTRAVDRGSRPLGRCRCCCSPLTRVRSWSSARHGRDRSSHVRGERPFIMSFAAPPPSSSAPKAHAHPPVSPATERDTAAEASADARGVLKVRPHPPRPHRSPTRHPIIVGKEKNARPSGRSTHAWSLPSDDPSR